MTNFICDANQCIAINLDNVEIMRWDMDGVKVFTSTKASKAPETVLIPHGRARFADEEGLKRLIGQHLQNQRSIRDRPARETAQAAWDEEMGYDQL